jgi:hypothetical protein
MVLKLKGLQSMAFRGGDTRDKTDAFGVKQQIDRQDNALPLQEINQW